jgi:hypothetical protein
MKRHLRPAFITGLFLLAGFFGAGCGEAREFPACQNHGGVAHIGDDATNGNVPVACKDGVVVRVPM